MKGLTRESLKSPGANNLSRVRNLIRKIIWQETAKAMPIGADLVTTVWNEEEHGSSNHIAVTRFPVFFS
jgi:hypothetical protein